MKHSYSNDDTCFSIDVIDKILEGDFDSLLDEDENFESESNTEEPSIEKITFNIDYKIKSSLEEPPMDLELKPLPNNLEYALLEEPSFRSVIISSQLSKQNKNKLVSVLKRHKQAFAWKTTDIPRICPSFYKHKIQLLKDKKLIVQKQRRLNPNMQEVMNKEIVKPLDTGIIYPIVDSPWVSLIYCVPKKAGITIVTNEKDELVPTRTVIGRNALSFNVMLQLLSKDKMLQRCKDAHLVLNWKKCQFMVKEGIVLRHKVSEAGLEVNKAKINVILKSTPTNIKGEAQDLAGNIALLLENLWRSAQD
ncbi:hypothetical protein Tco_0708833 [Tanacetum coccineum]